MKAALNKSGKSFVILYKLKSVKMLETEVSYVLQNNPQ
ncbi:hypothetical protein PAEVO_31990 [Paenibacillus sp. GM2FR]|nr:hypothetical protein PAEVO_31990 [Paenibacillus sp. GM2FR]